MCDLFLINVLQFIFESVSLFGFLLLPKCTQGVKLDWSLSVQETKEMLGDKTASSTHLQNS